MANKQIYSATYSNVPVFEFVTSEGPIMRRKSDSWINATHILKIARFPKAKRTRILEKDVQTGIHEKVQGGYGKYQGTYVPLDIGASIAKNFDVFDVLRPIFEFKYIEGKSETPPPAPKHSHASASNVARRQSSFTQPARKAKSMNSITGEPPRKRGRPRRIPLKTLQPSLNHSDTVPIDNNPNSGPNIGTFKRSDSLSSLQNNHHPSLSRQDTQQDALIISSNLNITGQDLQVVESDDERDIKDSPSELMSGKELFGTPRDSFERIVQSHHQHDPYGLLQYQNAPPSNSLSKGELIYNEYFSSLLTYFLDDNKIRSSSIPDYILNPPLPVASINVNRPIDNDGNTIFHWACSMASVSIIEFLMETFNIKPDLRNNKGETPLMFLVKFSNSYQLKNFLTLLELLLDSILLVDNSGKTVLHHIALIDNKNKEKFARYYMETLFSKIIELLDDDDLPDKKDLIVKFINHQDSDGNTAFHIVAYHLNKKCIKVLISYHKFIDFTLKNLVSYTVEDYLGWHNYILRLDDEYQADEGFQNLAGKNQSTQSLESQLYYSKLATNLHNNTSNIITEKLTELAYSVDKELNEKDEMIFNYHKILKEVDGRKLKSQKAILSFFKLEYLVEEYETSLNSSSPYDAAFSRKRSKLIQDEIHKVLDDLSFQTLLKKDVLDEKLAEYTQVNEVIQRKRLQQLASQFQEAVLPNENDDPFDLSVELTKEIIRRQQLVKDLYLRQADVPLSNDEFKENKFDPSVESKSIVANYPKDDKLNKYCKLISLCCGMGVTEVENSIDLLEQSLMTSTD
ncbi:uncharacterized protein PRCAT00003829001 [Priceomyces carsonii]|uniref:uncharacterized protein n=1 Tax=Priceomyces carsonii TaxID=28549 RepID=UPI002EDB3369|nr:unnamed protein product [Priceomyces carsonii]